MSSKIPQFLVVHQKTGNPVNLNERLISLELNDYRGLEADSLSLSLSDHDNALTFPKRGETLTLALGFKGEGLTDKGAFIVDEISYSGSPNVLTIRAKSAEVAGAFASGKERSFHQQTLQEIISTIAGENDLKAVISENLAPLTVEHIDQSGESTSNFLTRLAEEYDAIATVKEGHLLFMERGKGKTASGKDLPTLVIEKKNGDNFSFTLAESQNFNKVEAFWHDLATGKRGKVEAEKEQEGELESQSTKTKTIRHTYKSKQAAENAVKRTLAKVQRGRATFSIQLAEGRAEISPECSVKVVGFKEEIDKTEWVIKNVRHSLSSQGFTTSVELEIKI